MKTGGGSPLHRICQNAVLPDRTVFDPAWPLSIEGATEMQDVRRYILEAACGYSRFLCRQRWGLVSGEGSDSPALLTAITLNWYHLPSLRPGTRASSSSIVAVQFWSSVMRASNQPPNLSFF